jgi:uncharacterized delta-60 repeat protein
MGGLKHRTNLGNIRVGGGKFYGKTRHEGKTYVGGTMTISGFEWCSQISSINTDGSLDTSFSIGSGFNSVVRSVAVQSDGKVLVGGSFTSYNGTSVNRIVRLNTDGSIDTSFSVGSGFSSTVITIAVQSDGKVLMGGQFVSYNGTSVNRIVRLNTDGSIDTSFSVGSGFNSTVITIAVQSDGKVLAGGFFTSYNGTSVNRIVRLNTDGSIDTSFSVGSGFSGGFYSTDVYSIAVQSDGKILVGGSFTSYNGTSTNYIVRLNTGGSIDTSFSVGSGFNSGSNTTAVRSIVVQSDGKVLAGGFFTSYNGTSTNYIVRLNTDGSIDTSFVGSGFNGSVWIIALQSDGKILVGGSFIGYNGTSTNRIVRLNTDGSIDTSFSVGSGFNNIVYGIAVQSDGKVLMGGIFTSYNGTSVNYIVRLNTDGSIDTSFSVGSGFNNVVHSIAVQSDGKVLVIGQFASYNGTSVNRIVRLNSNGSIDTSFSVGSGFNSTVWIIAVQSDGKILVGGSFTSYNGTSTNRIVRLNTDGSIDTSFSVGSGFNNQLLSIAVQSDGKVLAGGSFTSYNGTSVNRIVRLNSNGSIDTSFSVGSGFNNQLQSIAVQSDGKVLVGGWFTSYNGTSTNRIVRLNSNGSIDTSFSVGSGFNSTVWIIAVQSDGKVLAGGNFTSYNGNTAFYLAKLNIDGSVVTDLAEQFAYNTIDGDSYTIVLE